MLGFLGVGYSLSSNLVDCLDVVCESVITEVDWYLELKLMKIKMPFDSFDPTWQVSGPINSRDPLRIHGRCSQLIYTIRTIPDTY